MIEIECGKPVIANIRITIIVIIVFVLIFFPTVL